MNSPKYGDRTAILKRNRPIWQSKDGQEQIDADDSDVSQAQILDRVKSDRVAVTQPEEDRRRRTIIVEKSKGTYGFTLQSYGIHYKKEQEIEMITYVDFVDYDGPAYRAGMREGDVILSINGHDMEKTDHKTLVNFIKNCDSRMRMVVLFEDCVRKVELHMRYIQVQRALRNKMLELERLCLKERELLEGKWKTHSLPARKKAASSTASGDKSFQQDPSTGTEYSYCRPTVSTEDVASLQPQVVLAYQYMEPQYRAYLLQGGQSIASTVGSTNSADYLLSWNSQQTSLPLPQPHQHQIVVKSCLKGCRPVNGSTSVTVPTEEQFTPNNHQHSAKTQPTSQKHRHLCAPCIGPSNQGDNGSLDAYDLASPCCDSRCVPTRRKSSHKQSDCKDKGSKESRKGSLRSSQQQQQPQQHQQQQHHYHQQPHHQSQQQSSHHSHRYMSLGGTSTGSNQQGSGSGPVSQCSLHSCASNWSEHVATASNTTSLSTDTLYWDDSVHSALAQTQLAHNTNIETYATAYHIYNPVKPKSWDNLTTKGIGGYGFGYGYLENTSHRSGSQKGHSSRGYSNKIPPPTGCLEDSCGRQYYIVTGPLVSKSSAENLLCRTDSSHSCDCLDASSSSSTHRFFAPEKTSKHGHHQHKQVHYEIHPLPQKQANNQPQQMQEKQQQQLPPPQLPQPLQQQVLRDMASQTDNKSAQGEVTRL